MIRVCVDIDDWLEFREADGFRTEEEHNNLEVLQGNTLKAAFNGSAWICAAVVDD